MMIARMFRYLQPLALAGCLCVGLLCAGACHRSRSAMSASEVADSFATAYFNWHLAQAMHYCEPESRIYLRYLASQVDSALVQQLRDMPSGAAVTVDMDKVSDEDTVAVATVSVQNRLRIDTIGRHGVVVPEAQYRLNLIKTNGHWMVRLNGLKDL